jgi:hypothetical protein
MCVITILSYIYNKYIYLETKDDKWTIFSKKEGFCQECYKYSCKLCTININNYLKEEICYRCYMDYRD